MKKGFTLIELLVVIAIIGILSAVVLTSLNSSREKANDTKKVSDVKQVALAMELARDQATGAFETASSSLGAYISPWPADSIDTFVSDGSGFCISATLAGQYFNASENGAGYSGTQGTAVGTSTCPTS